MVVALLDQFGDEDINDLYSDFDPNFASESRVGATDHIYATTLRPGERGWQVRVWQIEFDINADANTRFQIAGCEITVVRAMFPEEHEDLYTGDGMLNDQNRLLDRNSWLSQIASIDSFIEEPSIPDVPVREDDVISYTVTATCRIVPL